MNDSIGVADLLWFVAEVAVYIAVAWWGVAHDVPVAARTALGIALVGAFAAGWGTFVAPRARVPLRGAASVVFRVVWFGPGAAAALSLILG